MPREPRPMGRSIRKSSRSAVPRPAGSVDLVKPARRGAVVVAEDARAVGVDVLDVDAEAGLARDAGVDVERHHAAVLKPEVGHVDTGDALPIAELVEHHATSDPDERMLEARAVCEPGPGTGEDARVLGHPRPPPC